MYADVLMMNSNLITISYSIANSCNLTMSVFYTLCAHTASQYRVCYNYRSFVYIFYSILKSDDNSLLDVER